MQRDNQDNQDQAGDPEEELRRRVLSQVSADQPADEPAPAPTQHADDPPFNPPAPDAAPWEPPPSDPQPAMSFQPSSVPATQHVTDPPFTPPATAAAAPWSPGNPFPSEWAPGASQPSNAPPGYHWDANMANFVPDAQANAGAAAAPSSLQGFDTGKLNDPTYSNDKYTPSVRLFASAVQGLDPVSTPLSTVVARINANGGHATAVGEDRIDFGDGAGPIDVKIDSGRGGWWFQNGQDRLGGAPASAAVGAAGQPSAAGTSGTRSVTAPGQFNLSSSFGSSTAGAPAGLWNSDFTNQLRQLLMSRLSAASTPVDPNDPTITGPMNAARDEATRGSDRERTALAERLYAQGGLNTGSIDQQIQQSGEKNALGLSSLKATLMTREYASRRDELKSLLRMAIQSQDAESTRAIQAQLGELDATVRREGLGADLAKYSAYLNALGSEQVMN